MTDRGIGIAFVGGVHAVEEFVDHLRTADDQHHLAQTGHEESRQVEHGQADAQPALDAG